MISVEVFAPILLTLFSICGIAGCIGLVFYDKSETMKGGTLLALGFIAAPIFVGLGIEFRNRLCVDVGIVSTVYLTWRIMKHFESNAPAMQRRMERWLEKRRERERQMEERRRAKGNP